MSSGGAMQGLTDEQQRKFDENGYLVIANFFNKKEIERLKERAHQLLEGLDIRAHPKTKFSTGEKDAHIGDDYFLNSGDKVRFFFEEDAFDAHGILVVDKTRAINKIGHALHELDPIYREFSTRPAIKAIAEDLGFKDPRILQSMIIFKASQQPRIGGSVPSHQDSSFLFTQPLSAVGFWFALEDCTPDNGCMYFAPGSHKTVPVSKRFVRQPEGGTGFVNINGGNTAEPSEDQFICEPTPAGSLVLIHGSVLHKSSRNTSDKSRNIYTFHVIEGEAEYPKDNWLQPTAEMPFTKLKDCA